MTTNPFNVTNTSPVTVPTPAGVNGLPGYMSDKAAAITNTVLTEGRSAIFTNPMASAIGGVISNISNASNTISGLTSTCFSAEELGQINTALVGTGSPTQSLSTAMNDLLNHTNRLAGVATATGSSIDNIMRTVGIKKALEGGHTVPDFDKIIAVTSALNRYVNLIDAASGCINMLGGFTGLFSQNEVAQVSNTVNSVLNKVTNCLASVSEILYEINSAITIINSIIDGDTNFFQQAVDRLREAAMVSILEEIYKDPCGKFLLEQIGTQKLTGLLR